MTFADLAARAGHPPLEPATGEEFPLPAWYRSLYNTPLEKFSIYDIARSCRQRIFPEAMVPLALSILEENVLADGFYEGDLLRSLASISVNFWPTHPDLTQRVRSLIDRNVAVLLELENGDVAKEVINRLPK